MRLYSDVQQDLYYGVYYFIKKLEKTLSTNSLEILNLEFWFHSFVTWGLLKLIVSGLP